MSSILLGHENDGLFLLPTAEFRHRRPHVCGHTIPAQTKAYPKDVPHKACQRRCYSYRNKESKHCKALLNSLYSKDAEYLQTLMKDGVDPRLSLLDLETMCQTTALHVAIEKANFDMTEVLIKSGADLDARDGDGRTPIDIACKVKDHQFVRLLLEHGCSVLKAETRIVCLGMAFHHLIHASANVAELRSIIRVLLDTGLVRGWNGINDSVSYVNHVYLRDRQIFGLLFQAAHDVRDVGFIVASQEVLRRRRDKRTIDFFVWNGYTELRRHPGMTSRNTCINFSTRTTGPFSRNSGLCTRNGHTTNDQEEQTFSVPSLQGLCRTGIRRHLQTLPGKISCRIHQLEIPKILKGYIDFLDFPS